MITFTEALAMINRPADPNMPATALHALMVELLHGADALGEILSAAMPCGMEDPPIVSLGNGSCGILLDDRGDALTPDEVRGYAVRLMQIADEADTRNNEH